MARWGQDHAAGVAAIDPEVPTGLHDRAVDNWRPLLALSEAVGGEWPTRARAAARALAGVDQREPHTSEHPAVPLGAPPHTSNGAREPSSTQLRVTQLLKRARGERYG